MTLNVKKIEEEALRLSSRERALLTEHPIHSLDEDPDAGRSWLAEAECCSRAYKEGKAGARPADQVLGETH